MTAAAATAMAVPCSQLKFWSRQYGHRMSRSRSRVLHQ